MLNMGGSQKSKRVSWASDVNLCQVKLFLSEESPSQVGQGNQEHLQPKVTRPIDNLPPGFEGSQQWRSRISQIPVIKWKCPPRFKVNTAWQVVSGEESKEIEAETLRQAKVLEALYPRSIAIPPNPCEPSAAEDARNDQNTLVVPLLAVEEEDPPPLDTSPLGSSLPHNVNGPSTNPRVDPSSSPLSLLDPNILSSLQAALSPYASGPANQGNLIDQDLLIRILRSPNLVEGLVKKQGSISQNTSSPSSSIVHSVPQAPGLFDRGHPTPPWAPANLPFSPQSMMGPTSVPSVRPPSLTPEVSAPANRDISYYKSLIQQHGGERRDATSMQYSHQGPQHAPFGTTNQEVNNVMRPRDSKPRIMKPCMYFNTPRGCRNGASCSFLHDALPQQQQRIGGSGGSEVPDAKRMKMDREITGT